MVFFFNNEVVPNPYINEILVNTFEHKMIPR